MSLPDLNLLVPLDALLSEGSVARAADKLHVSPSAMSRTLARLREVTGDPLLVRAGRGLVATPRALELREQVAALVENVSSVLGPARAVDVASVQRTLTIRASEGFVESFGARLVVRARAKAPGLRFHFMLKADRRSALREGEADLEIGVVEPTTPPELRQQGLFRDRLVGVVRARHALAKGRVTVARYAQARHVSVLRRGGGMGRVDRALEQAGYMRSITCTVTGFSGALALARATDLVATVPERHTASLRVGMHAFTLPVPLQDIPVSMLWHPRLEHDTAHAWLRATLREVTRATS